ncbi:MAG TPA: phosphate-starvation-inducible PsiE family protein [Methanospirillum sp.]|uniref:phosphate-starvation-inducible PsiE family protein n=1 Tax=Methanospirillum sp. TaxID=45200 RepID=UPI002C34244E|nr:phosphate-starvation-inducible PsiE family protein [Methanospirillum sp.]HOJ95422.1 phosphate-starvation-inducible PsiE family protein [Methanospirillum sp.]HOL40297.1 phosphate-starvation-inducible PsiE family protein [Methanospirillum sp.]HPP79042.1 phosphate-starvation-inducible PsiE family protein [Methanospirillum sp.]
MPEISEERANQLVTTFSSISIVVYIGVAILLSIIAILSLIESFLEVIMILSTYHWEEGIIQVIYSILFTIIIIELFETVTVYLKTKRVPVRALLIVALTALIRHIIVINISETEVYHYLGISVVMAVLIAGVYLLKEDIHSGNLIN